ncbi:MAG: ATP synthase F1 subunit gamma [Candidatus Omnitrophota bacterium]|nr:ATP synthase F1 subunit gamma [Candidatus Omnitrophota bacterium]
MLQSLRTIKRRIRSVENTKKITRAMEMVSGAKLKKSEAVLRAGNAYFLKLEAMFKNLLCGIDVAVHPFLEERPKNNTALCVITSDTGLSSTYNDNIIRLCEQFIRGQGKEKIKLITVGKKAFSYFKKRDFHILHSYVGLQGVFSKNISDEIANTLTRLFLSKEADEVYIIYTHFISALKYKPTLEKFLNIERAKAASQRGSGLAFNIAKAEEIEYILEPSRERILEDLIPRYISAKMRAILLNAFTSEHSARMIAMKAATDNAETMIDSLTLLRNKARQASITKEIIEVSSAAELLKG